MLRAGERKISALRDTRELFPGLPLTTAAIFNLHERPHAIQIKLQFLKLTIAALSADWEL